MVVCGGAVALGLLAVVVALMPAQLRLADVLASLDGTAGRNDAMTGVHIVDPLAGRLERFGLLCYQRLRLPLSQRTARMLALRGRSVSDFFAEKAVWVMFGLAAPLLYAAARTLMGGPLALMPFGLSVAGAVIGYFVPDLLLRRSATAARDGASEALFMFFDLVILERLASQSVTHALHSAASVSEATIFVRIRRALDRARLEQVPPWYELRRLAAELELPAIADMADVLKLDEQGAALAEPLRVRVRELRDAQLTHAKQEAQVQTERMTLWATLPVMIFGITFLIPPLLLMLQG